MCHVDMRAVQVRLWLMSGGGVCIPLMPPFRPYLAPFRPHMQMQEDAYNPPLNTHSPPSAILRGLGGVVHPVAGRPYGQNGAIWALWGGCGNGPQVSHRPHVRCFRGGWTVHASNRPRTEHSYHCLTLCQLDAWRDVAYNPHLKGVYWMHGNVHTGCMHANRAYLAIP